VQKQRRKSTTAVVPGAAVTAIVIEAVAVIALALAKAVKEYTEVGLLCLTSPCAQSLLANMSLCTCLPTMTPPIDAAAIATTVEISRLKLQLRGQPTEHRRTDASVAVLLRVLGRRTGLKRKHCRPM
jgi:hypothetical protein